MALIVAIDDRYAVSVTDPSGAGDVRRHATRLAESLDFDPTDTGRLAIVATEAATNLAKHAGSGEILLRALRLGDARGVNLVAIDRGRGMADLAGSRRDGFSTLGTSGTGLGSIERQSSSFDIFSGPGGTLLSASVWSRRAGVVPQLPVTIGAVCRPRDSDAPSGDAWTAVASERRTILLLADGLGHGAHAADAAAVGIRICQDEAARRPDEILTSMHHAMRSTRGAAAAVAALDHERGEITFAGIGNIAGVIVTPDGVRHMVSHHGTLGHVVRRVQEFSYPWPPDATVILHSDGILSRWDLAGYPGLLQHDPTLVAAALYRDFCRGRDDLSAVVVRRSGP